MQPVFDGERAFGSIIPAFCLYDEGKDPENPGAEGGAEGAKCDILSKQGEKSNKEYVLARPSLIYIIDKLHYLLNSIESLQ